MRKKMIFTMKEELVEKIKESAIEGANGWAKEMFCTAIMQELINGQTELVYIAMPELSEKDKPQVKRIIKDVMTKELLKVIANL